MSFWQTIRSVLGLGGNASDGSLPPLVVTQGAEARLVTLPAGHGALISLQPAPAGHLVCVAEGPLPEGGPHPELEALPIGVADEDFEKLRGLVLDHDGLHWRVQAELRIKARETPNPDGRLYVLDRKIADGRAFFGRTAERPPWLVRQLLGRDDVLSVLLRDASLTVERRAGADWDAIDAAVGAAVREHVLSAGGILAREAAPERNGRLEEAVADVLEREIAPAIHRDGGDVELVDVKDGLVRVRLVGACRTCPASVLTLKGGIERALKDAFPGEIETVEAVD